MKDREKVEGRERESEKAPRPNGGAPILWILAAFGLLFAGLAGGTALGASRSDIGWTVPLAGFAGYLLAFRRGMILWNPKIDGSWRRSFRATPPAGDPKNSWDPEATIRLLHRDTPPPSQSVLKVIR